MNKKAIRIAAAVSAAALLCGGIYLLVKNDLAQKIKWRDIMIYAPTPIAPVSYTHLTLPTNSRV